MAVDDGAEPPSTWYRVHDLAPSAVAPVLLALRQMGIETEPADTLPGSGCGIVFFSQFSTSLLSVIEQLLARHSILLSMALGPHRPTSPPLLQPLSPPSP